MFQYIFLTFSTWISAKPLTGSARVTSFGCDISKLLNQRAEKFAWLQPVLAGPLSTAGMWCSNSQARRRNFTKSSIQELHFPSLMGLKLRDFLQMSEETQERKIIMTYKLNDKISSYTNMQHDRKQTTSDAYFSLSLCSSLFMSESSISESLSLLP